MAEQEEHVPVGIEGEGSNLGDKLAELVTHEADIERLGDSTTRQVRLVMEGRMTPGAHHDNEDWAEWQAQQAREKALRLRDSINEELGSSVQRKRGRGLLGLFSRLRPKH